MKTKPTCEPELTLEDIVFEKRNRFYGAYELNRKRRRYLFLAFVFSLTAFATAVAIPFLKMQHENAALLAIPDEFEVEFIGKQAEELPVILPPPPDHSESIRKSAYLPPEITEDANPLSGIPDINELLVNAGNVPVEADTVLPYVEQSPEIPPDDEAPVFHPEEEARFGSGGVKEFHYWVQESVRYPSEAAAMGIFGKVIIGFCIDKTGHITDMRILRSAHTLLDEEAARVIASSPVWYPAKQGGRTVRQQFVIPVVFQLKQ